MSAMSPPSPVESTDSLDSTPPLPPEAIIPESSRKKERPEDVMIPLSLPHQPLASTAARTRSPLARSHFRSRSLAEVPPMTRAYSSPGLDSRGRYIFVNGRGAPTSNPIENAPKLHQAAAGDDALESRMAALGVSEPIAEHAGQDPVVKSPPPPQPPPDTEPDLRAVSPVMPAHHTLPRMGRRRPSSPLHFHPGNSAGSGNQQFTTGNSPLSSAYSSPMMLNSKYNESFPTYSSSSASSMPSTPTSLRSRSPSISSLETIPDIPDAEAAANEADQIAALKAAADRVDDAERSGSNRRRGSSDVPGPAGSLMGMRVGSGGYIARTDKRKRWSVCGAERRQDLDLETIWED